MPHFLFVPALVGITATLFAQSSAPSTSELVEGSASTPCILTGRVVTAAEGNALKSARVVLIPEHFGSPNQIYAITSDGDGRFTLKDIPPGRYQFFATHTGFVEHHYKAGTTDTGPLLSLTPGAKITDVLFHLIAAGVISGRVSNEDDEAMQEAEVIALRRLSEEEIEDEAYGPRKSQLDPVASAQTDDRGQYRIFGLKPGEYYIRAEDSFQPSGQVMRADDGLRDWLGREYGYVYYPGVTQVSQAQVVPIKPGEEVQDDLAPN